MSNYPAIPEPQLTPESLRESVMALKEAVENIIGIRGPTSTTLASSNALTTLSSDLATQIEEVDVALDGKADVIHTHIIDNVTGLQAALDGKEPAITAGTTSQYWRGDKTWAAFPTQRLVGVYSARYTGTTGLTTTFPNSATVPAATAGTQIISVNVTTTSATQVVDFWFQTFGVCSPAVFCGTGVYVGTTCVAATNTQFSGHSMLAGRYAPGAAGTYTFSVRIGPNSTATLTLNSSMGSAANTTLLAHVVEP